MQVFFGALVTGKDRRITTAKRSLLPKPGSVRNTPFSACCFASIQKGKKRRRREARKKGRVSLQELGSNK